MHYRQLHGNVMNPCRILTARKLAKFKMSVSFFWKNKSPYLLMNVQSKYYREAKILHEALGISCLVVSNVLVMKVSFKKQSFWGSKCWCVQCTRTEYAQQSLYDLKVPGFFLSSFPLSSGKFIDRLNMFVYSLDITYK